MMDPDSQALSRLRIAPEKKARRVAGPWVMIALLAVVLAGALAVYLLTRHQDRQPIASPRSNPASAVTSTASDPPAPAAPSAPLRPAEVGLTVSGYIIPRERIEISPRFQGIVQWIGVKKGDPVKKGEVIVRLEEDEFRARVLEAEGRLALAEANLSNAVANLNRQVELAKNNVESERVLDDARRARDASAAEVTMARGQLDLARIYLDWCTIRAPIDGTILEKMVDPNELVVPQSFGGARGPSTAFVSLADLSDLQVEIDLNEADTPKVHLQQKCRVSPEAYPQKTYDGTVVEIAPEANRQKGTLQVKVQITNPDRFLTPELSAKVDFLVD